MAEFAKTMDKTHNLRSMGSPVGFPNVLQSSEEGLGWDLLRINRYIKSPLEWACVSHTPGNLAYCESIVPNAPGACGEFLCLKSDNPYSFCAFDHNIQGYFFQWN